MSYNPNVKTYYGSSVQSATRVSPSPLISFNTELVYANDVVIGYTYMVTLSGNATALDLVNDNNAYGIGDVSAAIEKIRDTFSHNGYNLYIVNQSNITIFEGRGGMIRDISFQESGNNWVNYAPYQVVIEFNEVLINGCAITNPTLGCTGTTLDTPTINLVDVSKYRIKAFNDGWSFNLGDNIYNNYGEFQNQHFEIEYKISATGKNYFKSNDEVLPAWEQAKNFVQDRLYTQVTGLIRQILQREGNGDGCVATQTLGMLHALGVDTTHSTTSSPYVTTSTTRGPGSLDLNSSTHKIYNESISCDTSEADGTFSATYKAILKYYPVSTTFYAGDTLHTFTVNTSHQDDNRSMVRNISVQGSITGLIEGGIINSPHILELPRAGKLLLASDTSNSKYAVAKSAYNMIGTDSDLTNNFKNHLNISSFLDTDTCGNPQPSSHSVTHDYTNGIITYNTDFNSIRACQGDRSYRNISMTIEDSVPMTAEFVIPGRANGPLIQYLGINTPKKISLNIEGVVDRSTNSLVGLPNDVPMDLGTSYKLTQSQDTYNPIDGSYSITRAYIQCEG